MGPKRFGILCHTKLVGDNLGKHVAGCGPRGACLRRYSPRGTRPWVPIGPGTSP